MEELLPSLQKAAFPLLTFLLGMLVGHRFALWRDRRKDFNEAAEPVRRWLLAEIERPSGSRPKPGAAELDLFEQRIGWLRRKRWQAALQALREERERQRRTDVLGQGQYLDPDAVRQAARACLPFTAQR